MSEKGNWRTGIFSNVTMKSRGRLRNTKAHKRTMTRNILRWAYVPPETVQLPVVYHWSIWCCLAPLSREFARDKSLWREFCALPNQPFAVLFRFGHKIRPQKEVIFNQGIAWRLTEKEDRFRFTTRKLHATVHGCCVIPAWTVNSIYITRSLKMARQFQKQYLMHIHNLLGCLTCPFYVGVFLEKM